MALANRLSIAIIGASGYVGGELARLALGHPEFELTYVTSERNSGKPIGKIHPNLRGATKLKFVKLADVQPVDVVFSCLPHGTLVHKIDAVEKLAQKLLVDCSADFRLHDAGDYPKWYNAPHAKPAKLAEFVYGSVELHRDQLKTATRIAVPGCTATSAILAGHPLVRSGLIDAETLVFDIKTGSSGGGAEPSIGAHHPERAGTMRSYKLAGHRHTGEAIQELHLTKVPGYSVTSMPTVRGIVCHLHAWLKKPVTDLDLWQIYRGAYGTEPFVRLIKELDGIHSLPEPKILAGTNYCDIGWVLDEGTNRITVVSALDNLVKGAAGQAIHAANVALGFDERSGLAFLGLHPTN